MNVLIGFKRHFMIHLIKVFKSTICKCVNITKFSKKCHQLFECPLLTFFIVSTFCFFYSTENIFVDAFAGNERKKCFSISPRGLFDVSMWHLQINCFDTLAGLNFAKLCQNWPKTCPLALSAMNNWTIETLHLILNYV